MTHDELRELIAREIARDDCGLGPFDDCADCICRNQADATLAALSTAGLAIVPVEWTEAMRMAGENASVASGGNEDDIYAAMLAASPFTAKAEQ